MERKKLEEKIREKIIELKKHMQDKTGWSIFLGAGASKCAHLPTMRELTSIVLNEMNEGKASQIIKEIIKNLKEDTSTLNPTIEDILEELYLLLHLKEEKKNRNRNYLWKHKKYR